MNASLQLTSIQLRVPDLARSLRFYVDQLGFVLRTRSDTGAALATSADAPEILQLVADPAAPAAPRDAAGLFHAALIFPSRAALGAWLRIAAERGVEFDGFSDHGVSEALYFPDPDGNGLEFYVDRPREAWPFVNGQLAMGTEPLDVQSLLAAGRDTAGAAPLVGARWGHLHLRVTELERSENFYRSTLGLETTQANYPGARFLAADGYHHHLGLNIWGHPRQPQPRGAPGLIAATFASARATANRELRDPDGIAVHITPLSSS
jgi:catechol 2,3-dioxygenase